MMNNKSIKVALWIGVSMSVCVFAYLSMIACGFTNNIDGLWQPTYFRAGNWELSIGRFGWVAFDKLKGGYASEPYNALLTFGLIVSGMMFVFFLFEWKSHYLLYAFPFYISCTICCYLSYVYMSPTFGAAFFAATLSTWFITRSNDNKRQQVINCILAIIFLTTSLSLYQADIGCFSLIITIYAMYKLLKYESKNSIIILGKGLIVATISCVLYKIAWDIILRLTGVSAADYKGANALSIMDMIKMIPNGIKNAYVDFFEFYLNGMGYYICRKGRTVIFILLVVVVIYKGIKLLRKNMGLLLQYLILVCLLPLATNIFYLLVTQDTQIRMQMTGPLALVVPLLLCILDVDIDAKKRKLLFGVCILFLYGNIFAVGTDMDAMRQGINSSLAVMNDINTSIIEEDMLDTDYKYAFIGKISDNTLFRKNSLWDNANSYARVGDFSISADCILYSYNGLVDDMGLNLQLVSLSQYEDILSNTELIDNMPVYPKKGSITKNGDVVIVKVSDTY